MRHIPSIALLAAALLAGAATATSPASREFASTAKVLAALTPGKPTSCISLSRSRPTRFLDADTIAYEDGVRRYYVNRTTGGCRFDDDAIVVTRTPTDQLCRGDIVRLVDRYAHFERGSCSLGDFVPYTR